jgi:hypothetical protein
MICPYQKKKAETSSPHRTVPTIKTYKAAINAVNESGLDNAGACATAAFPLEVADEADDVKTGEEVASPDGLPEDNGDEDDDGGMVDNAGKERETLEDASPQNCRASPSAD